MISQGDQQLAQLLALKGQLATASPRRIASIVGEIATAVTVAASTARQAQQASAVNGQSSSATMASARQAAREALNDFDGAYFKQRKFDAYLSFASEEDEREFREREAQRQREIEAARAEGTPQGDKRALDLSIAQLKDAGAHGADKSPDYTPLLTKLEGGSAALAAQIDPPKLETKTATLSAPDPLDGPMPDASVPLDLMAKFKSAGVVVADQRGTGHGVTAGKGQQDQGPRLPS